ncbi:hypothetical protein AeRB84_010821 [Aphanomyces euteiches]|nr:hypothetical protein AeRB84_010821 [Aphanomyces euteiches]
MVKVRVKSRNKATARFSRFSLCYTGLFVLKLASTPLMAYLTEPLPWSIQERSLEEWDSFDAFKKGAYGYLKQRQKHIVSEHDISFDSSSITFIEHRTLVLPFESIPLSAQDSYFFRFPGALFYGHGMHSFVTDFLGQNETTRRTDLLFQCQHNYYFGVIWGESCVWVEPMLDQTYKVSVGGIVWESTTWCCCKFGFRCLLTLFILRVLWQRYCRYYFPLLRALQECGVDDKFSHYEVIVGDPTYLILSDPRVAVVMVVDIMMTPIYVAWSWLRVCQYYNLTAFALGCFYFTRFVRFGAATLSCDRCHSLRSTTITYVECRKLVLPVDVASTSWLSSYFIRFPGAVTYGLGIQTFVRELLSQDAATRRRNRLFQCQRNYYYGIVLSDSCVWLEPLLLDISSDIYTVYFGTFVWEGQLWSWLKLAFRSLLTLFILRVLWLRYCRHYLPLLQSLQEIGVDDQFCRYEAIVGDPMYLILSDPRVTTVMVIDILLTTPPYVAWSVLRVCQYRDLIAFCLGCLYLTRSVWCGYFAMRCVSYIAKVRRWEHKFAPIDPGVLGFVVFLYGGPIFSLLGNASLMAIFLLMWSCFLPSSLALQAADFAPGVIIGIMLTGCLPVGLSLAFQNVTLSRAGLRAFMVEINRHWTRLAEFVLRNQSLQRISTSIVPAREDLQLTLNEDNGDEHISQHRHRSFNDFKNRLLFALIQYYSAEPREKTGGSLHYTIVILSTAKCLSLVVERLTALSCATHQTVKYNCKYGSVFWIAWTQEPKTH